MKKILEFIPLVLFIVAAVLGFIAENKEACIGFIVASMVQARVIILLYLEDEKLKEEEKK